MQLDRPAKRRPRYPQNRPPNANSDSEQQPNLGTRTDPFSQQSDPFQQVQRSTQVDPFGPHNPVTPPRANSSRVISSRLGAPFSTQGAATAAAPDPFQPLQVQPNRGGSGYRGEPTAIGQNANAFGQVSSFGQNAAPFDQNVAPFSQNAVPFGQNAAPFGQNQTSFGQEVAAPEQNASSFGQNATSFGHNAGPFDWNATSVGDNTTSFGQSPQEFQKQTRTPISRRLGSTSFAKSSREYTPGTPFQGTTVGERDLERERDNEALHTTPDNDTRKAQSTKPNQLLLKSVPLPLFSRAALQRHFSSVPGANLTHVSLRGSRRPDSRRTAVISFATDHQAQLALRNGQSFKGAILQLSLFRQSAQANEQLASESNELFFNNVPESLFSEESVTDLFDSISESGVAKVSLKERPHYGSVKRTAVITFISADAAAAALRNLPLYNGRSLTVSFRRMPARPQSNLTAAAATRDHNAADIAMLKGAAREYEDVEIEQDVSNDFPVAQPLATRARYDNASRYHDFHPHHEELRNEQEQMAKPERADKEAEIAKLKAAILKKQKERSQIAHTEREKRVKKLVIPKQRDTSKAQQQSRDSGWRKVGEKVDIKNATTFIGTCLTMCPFKEFEERVLRRDISVFETDGGTEPAFAKSVKKYRRSAAISEQPSPEEVRPPTVLLETMEHLKDVCDSTHATFADVHNFVRDRTRSLRQDFTLQGVRDDSCINIHEESVRFHILSEHRLYGTDPTVFSSKQNREQLDKCLISLREMYDLRRENDLDTSPNEPEMQAYYMLTQMSDPKTCVQLCTGFAQDVRCSPPVHFALQVVKAASEGFGSFTRYFSLVRSAPYLMACLMHSRFSVVRGRALAVINVTHGNPNSKDNIPISAVARQLGFESDSEAEEFCRTLGMKVEVATLPSMGSEMVTICTPSEEFDETKVSDWESSKADILIESKAQGFKTSEIVTGFGRNDFKTSSPGKAASEKVETKKPRPVLSRAPRLPPVVRKEAIDIVRNSVGLPKRDTVVAPKFNLASGKDLRTPPKQSFIVENVDARPQEDQRTKDQWSQAPHLPEPNRGVPEFPTRPPTFQYRPMPVAPTQPISFGGIPHSSPPMPATAPDSVSLVLPSVHPVNILAPRHHEPNLSTTFTIPDDGIEKMGDKVEIYGSPEALVLAQPQKGAIVSSREDVQSTAEPDEEPSPMEPETPARDAALEALLTDLVDTCEADFKNVQKVINDAEAGTLKFPKAMEIWDSAKDILVEASERTQRGFKEFESVDAVVGDATRGRDAGIEEMREKLRFCSHHGTQLRDQLDETFSMSLSVATAHLKHPRRHASFASDPSKSPQIVDQLSGFSTYGLQDEDTPFEVRELPDSGAEVQSILRAMLSVGLHRWQAVITNVTSPSTDVDEVGIAQRWLKQRLSTATGQKSGSLCLVDAKESGSPSISIREIKEASNIPYTADLIVVPCDVRTMEREPSSSWSSLKDVLRKNRSIALSCDVPPPTVVVLYYCGSHDVPLWFMGEASASNSFATFQKVLQEKEYVASCQRLELPRTTTFQGMEFKPFTAIMNASVRCSAQFLCRMGSMPRVTDFKDHLVHVANRALGAVLGSSSSQVNTDVSLRVIQEINASWDDVARRLRREESRWPEELTQRRRIVDAYTHIEGRLLLPAPRDDSLIADYVRDMAAVAGVGIPAVEHLDGALSFCSALGHLMNAFVQQKLMNCPTSRLYLPLEPHEEPRLRKARPTLRYLVKPSKIEEPKSRPSLRYAARTEPPRKTKRLRAEVSPSDGYRRVPYPPRRRFSIAPMDQVANGERYSEIASNRRRSLPASYGRRRMLEVVDGICREEQAFDDLIQETMDALTAKRRRLERGGEVLAV